MATNKELTEAQLRKAKADDAVVYKVMLALVLFCAGIMGLRSLRAYYDTVGGFEALYDATPWIAFGAAAVSLLLGIAAFLCKNKYVRSICPWLLTGTLFTTVTALVMHYSWTNDFPLLYILLVGILVQYIVQLLYRWEFFLVSLNTITAGGIFYRLSRGGGVDSLELFLLVCLALLLTATTVCAFLASKNHGKLVLGERSWQVFGRKFNPTALYTVNGLWLVCMIAALLLAPLFSYYCMFAAIAAELIAAVYYTFQLN